MTENLGTGEHLMKDSQQIRRPFSLGKCACVARQSVLVQSSLVADADGTMVVRHGVSPHLHQYPMLHQRTVATDIEVMLWIYSTVSTYRIFSNILIVGL